MKSIARPAMAGVSVAGGVILGVALILAVGSLRAEEPAPEGSAAATVDISEADAEKVKQASDALATAQAALEQDGAYRRAVRGLNPYAVLSGGLDAMADLESGHGVDPITFAGLHAGLAEDEVTPHLAFDANGRLTYKGKLIRMYPPERMRGMLKRQEGVLAVTAGTRRVGAGAAAEEP